MYQPSPRMRRWLDQLLHTHDTPQRTAAAYALGVLIGFSPLLGLHTLLGILLAFTLNLNRVSVLLGVYSNLPWILPAYYTLTTVVGARLLGITSIKPGLLHELSTSLADVSWANFRQVAHALTPLASAFALGSTIGAVILGVVAYRVALAVIVAHRRHLEHQQVKQNQ